MTNSAQPAQFAQPGPGLVSGERVLVAVGAMGTMLQASDALIAFHPEARYFSA
jgi:hypothetical protein